MDQLSDEDDSGEMRDLLHAYNNLKMGKRHTLIEEEDFERIIDYFDDNEDLIKAMEAAENGIRQYPYSSTLLLKKADLLIAAHKYEDALKAIFAAELFDTTDTLLYVLKTEAYLALGKQEEALYVMKKALDFFEGDQRIDCLFDLSDVFDDYEHFQEVFNCLRWILEQQPNNKEALIKICFWTDFTGNSEESIRLHLKIIDNHPFNELAWYNLGSAYQSLKLYEKAIDAYLYALAINDKLDIAYRSLAGAYMSIHKYKEAADSLQNVLELSRPEETVYEAMGYCFYKMRNYSQARLHYRKASHLNKENSKLYYKIAQTYFKENQLENAIKQLEVAIAIHPRKPEYNLLMGACKSAQGNIKEAVNFYSSATKARPKNINGWEALIKCLLQGSYFEEALEQTARALKATKGKDVFELYHSILLFHTGKPKEGLLQLEQTFQLNPKLLKKFIDLQPDMLHNQNVLDLIMQYKGKKNKQ